MARLLRELVRRRPPSNRFIATVTDPSPSTLSPPLCLRQPFLGQTKLDDAGDLNPRNEGLRAVAEVAHQSKLQIYPSFSFGFFINPIVPSQLNAADLEHPGMIWADSVKKKRKRKMNKHKYKKLRKRLRRKTKT